jgi:multicomponent Na+:H+ antiporter subunit B
MVFLPAVAGFLFLLLDGLQGLAGFGHYPGPYGSVLNGVAVGQRHATNLVTAVNFDYRAFDTLGEEFILFTATTAIVLILRHVRGEHERPTVPDARRENASEALRGVALALVAALIVLGGYVVAHGALTPGGGFQGGVLLAAAAFLVFLGGEVIAMKRLAPEKLLEFADAAGAAGFALIGIGGVLFAEAFFENFLPLGKPGSINSAGTMAFVSLSIGIEVAGAFLLIWTEFLDQAVLVRSDGGEE